MYSTTYNVHSRGVLLAEASRRLYDRRRRISVYTETTRETEIKRETVCSEATRDTVCSIDTEIYCKDERDRQYNRYSLNDTN